MKIQQFNDFHIDLLQSILWQYEKSTNLISLLNQKQDWFDIFHSDFWIFWKERVFDLRTADLFGLAIWSIILNVPLFVDFNPELDSKPIWGFNEYDPAYPDLINDTNWNFYGNSVGIGANFSTRHQQIELSDAEQRFLLRLKYFQLSTLTNIAGIPIAGLPVESNQNIMNTYSINTFLNYLCTDNTIGYTGTIYALDGLDMTMVYVLTANDFPPDLLQAILDLDVFPRPAGVGIRIIIGNDAVWGFGIYNQNFENGNFID